MAIKITTSIIAGIAATLLLQPCPAPLIAAPIAALATGFVAGGGVAIGGALAANSGGGGGAAAKRDLGHIFRASNETSGSSNLVQKCIADMFNSESVRAKIAGSGRMTVYNSPRSCMDAVDAYNDHPDIKNLNNLYGSLSCRGSSTIRLNNVPDYMFQGNPQTLIDNLQSEIGPGDDSSYRDN